MKLTQQTPPHTKPETVFTRLCLHFHAPLLCALAFVLTAGALFAGPEDPNTADLARSFLQRINRYHAGTPNNGETLRVVYFYPADAEPAPQDTARLSRIVTDIRDFYIAEMKYSGFIHSVMPLEMNNDAVNIHYVKGSKPASAYGYEYEHGKQIRSEIEAALDGQISFSDDFILIISALCTRRDDGRFFFNAPYYGGPGSDQRSGYCFVADCPLQDPALLTDTETRIAYEEHYGTYSQTLADFNSKYLGGIAHELGHGLGLPHASQSPQQRRQRGVSLMGSGNHTYRRERWHPDEKGSFLTFGACVQLAVHPLFTQSDRDRRTEPKLDVEDLHFARDGRRLIIEGTVRAEPQALAVIVYSDPEKDASTEHRWTDYDAVTSVAEVAAGRFSAAVADHDKTWYRLRLAFCHLNGAVSTIRMQYQADEAGRPDADTLNTDWNQQKK